MSPGRRRRIEDGHRPGSAPVRALGGLYRGLVTRGALLILGAWIAGVVLLPGLATSEAPSSTDLGGLLPPDSHALQVKQEALRQFPLPLLNETTVVVHDPHGLSLLAHADAAAWALKFTQRAADAPQRADRHAIVAAVPLPTSTNDTLVTYLYLSSDLTPDQQVAAARRYAAHFAAFPGVRTYVTGLIPAQVSQHHLLEDNLTLFRIVSVLAVALIVALTFRSLVAALAVLVAAAAGFVVAQAVLALLAGSLGFSLPDQVEPLVVALLLGVVTDYSMLLFQDFRDRLTRGQNHGAAVRDTLRHQAPVVAVAGLTVTGGTAALLAANLEMFRIFGPALAIAVLIGMIVSLTVTPAIMTLLGRRLFRPIRNVADERPHRASWLARLTVASVSRRASALLVVIVGTLLLLVVAWPVLGMRYGVSFTAALPSSDPAARGAAVLSHDGIRGVTGPTEVLVEKPGVANERIALARLQAGVSHLPGVAEVLGPADNPLPRRFGVFLAPSGDAARLVVIFDSDPLAAPAIHDFTTLRDRLPALAAQAGLRGASVDLTGQTAVAAELTGLTGQSLRITVLVAVGIELIILILFLRALVAPLVLLACGLLSVAAALGLATWFFQDVRGDPDLTFYAPFATAVLLFSLGSDYNVFAVGNIWREARNRSLREALRIALPRSSRAITAAGFTLAITMALVAIIPIETFRELAFTMAVGLLIDTTVVRPLITPALLTLLGRVASWPSRRLALEPAWPRRQRVPRVQPVPAALPDSEHPVR
jgi:RND superfamily putative drug exporter